VKTIRGCFPDARAADWARWQKDESFQPQGAARTISLGTLRETRGAIALEDAVGAVLEGWKRCLDLDVWISSYHPAWLAADGTKRD
jgi:hypothetical protein